MKVLPKTSSSVCEYLCTRPLGMFLIQHPTAGSEVAFFHLEKYSGKMDKHHSENLVLSFLYLLSKYLQFVRPGFNVRHSVTDVSGLCHTSGSLLDGSQSLVSQFLDLDVQSCQVGATLQPRNREAAGEQRQEWGLIYATQKN